MFMYTLNPPGLHVLRLSGECHRHRISLAHTYILLLVSISLDVLVRCLLCGREIRTRREHAVDDVEDAIECDNIGLKHLRVDIKEGGAVHDLRDNLRAKD